MRVPMNVLDLIREGVVLTAAVDDGARMLLAPSATIRSGRLVFYDLSASRARSLKFDAFEWVDDRGVWLIHSGDRVARIHSVWRESFEAGEAWRQHWLDRPEEEKLRLLQEFQRQIDTLDH